MRLGFSAWLDRSRPTIWMLPRRAARTRIDVLKSSPDLNVFRVRLLVESDGLLDRVGEVVLQPRIYEP